MAVTEIPCGTRNIAEEDVELELILVTAEAEVREAMAAAPGGSNHRGCSGANRQSVG
uniref:Wsv110 n=1 Tax=White spot syndrome virus TaxID=92652 RepID=A0A2U9G9Q9_WSSV|nr:wsv110 [Shrimp white spot syndrome virus]